MSLKDTPETYEDFIKNLGRDRKPVEENTVEGQLFLIGTDECPACDEAKDHFREDIKAGKIIVTSINEEKGLKMVQALDIREAPTLVLEKEEGNVCLINSEGEVSRCALLEIEIEKPEEEECPECADGIGGAWSVSVARELNMPGVDELEQQLKDGATGESVLEKVLNYAQEIGDNDAQDFLKGIKKEMGNALACQRTS